MHKTKSSLSRRLLAMMMAVVMAMGLMPTAFAHAEGEEGGDHAHDTTPYTITVYNEKEPNKHGTLSYTVTCREDGDVSGPYTLADGTVTAYAGDTITLYYQADEGYALGSIGYIRADRVEQSFNIKVPDAVKNEDKSTAKDENGNEYYAFSMPSDNIYVGAAFFKADSYYVLKEAGSSNSVANIDPLQVINMGLNDAWLHENAEEVSMDIHLDKRILDMEELSGQKMTFRLEARQVGDSGFLLVGEKNFTLDELKALIEKTCTGTQVDEKDREYFILRDVRVPLYEDVDLEYTPEGTYEVYCTAMYTLEGWTNAVGAQNYRWGYSGGDRAYILENETPIPTSMVYLYNLEPETYHGALVAEAVARVEEEFGININVKYFTPENMTERIGYLAEWPGYDSYGELGVDRQPSEKSYKKKIVLYCSLPSMVRDTLGDYIRETGVTNLLSSKLTAYGASKSFEEFYKTQEAESEVFTAALALSLLTYETSTVVTEEKYGNHELWPEFKAAYDECVAIINVVGEQEVHVYNDARLKLQDVYLRILGKTMLEADFAFLIEEYDADNYKITIDPETWPEGLEATYRWYDASRNDNLIIPKDQLYKVVCTISATDDNMYYGFKQISLSPPTELEYSVSPSAYEIDVNFTKYETLTNTPEPITYTAELYQGEELLATLKNTTGKTLTFDGLTPQTQYSVKVYASNIVGRTTYLTETVTTKTISNVGQLDKPVEEDPFPFADVVSSHWFYSDVAYVAEQGLMNGTSDTTFSPNDATTRGMLMTILARLAGEDTTGGSPWYEKGMAWAMENGISDGTNPTGNITREQLATMLWRYAGSPEADGDLSAFVDSHQVSPYAVDALIWAVDNGIMNGNPDGTLDPQGSATRAQMAAMLHRFCENIL